MLADPCADPGILARVVQARLPENSSDNGFCLFFCPQLLQFYSGFSMVYFKENYNFTRFRGGGGGGGGVQPIPGGGGGPTYSGGGGGSNLFRGGGGAGAGGPNANSRNPQNF